MSAAIHRLTIVLTISALLTLGGCGGSSGTKVCNVAGGCCNNNPAACPALQFLYANGINSQIATFPVIAGSALGAPTFTPSASPSLGMAAMNNQFLYVSNPVPLSGSAIDAWAIAPGTGTLTTIPSFSLGIFSVASGMAVDSNASVLYVADAGKIDALHSDATGALTPLANSPFASGTNLYLVVDPTNKFLFASVDDPPGGLFAFTIDSGGSLTPVAGSPFAATTGNSQPGQVVVDGTSSYVYAVLNTTGQVAGFAIAPSTGVLTPVPGSPFIAGKAPLAIATTSFQTNNYLYVSNAQDGTVSGYSINGANGVLTPIPGSPFAIAAGALTTNPENILFASTAAGMRVFDINPQTGALTEVKGSPFPGPGATVLAFVQ